MVFVPPPKLISGKIIQEWGNYHFFLGLRRPQIIASNYLWCGPKKHAIYFSYRQPLFSFLPACVDTRKINFGVGVLVQDPMIIMTLNLNRVALTFTRKKMRLETESC